MSVRKEWHLDKTVSVGHLASTLVVAISVLAWASAVDRRIEQNAQAIAYLTQEQIDQSDYINTSRIELKNDIKQLEKRLNALRLEIKKDLGGISQKLDRLIEKKVS